MNVDRRIVLAAAAGLGSGAVAAAETKPAYRRTVSDASATLRPEAGANQTAELQLLIDASASSGAPVVLPPGRFLVGNLTMRAGTRMISPSRATTLEFVGGQTFLSGDAAHGVVLSGLIIDGMYRKFDDGPAEALVSLYKTTNVSIEDCEFLHSAAGGLNLIACSGTVSANSVHNVVDFGIKSLDANGLLISANTINDCGNNGVLVWRSESGEDATMVCGNRITRVRNSSGGTGEYGNGINVYRAGSVLVQGNRISDCAYSAIRGNSASNIQIVANSCERLGEVAIYSEFGFEGALISSNVIDNAATGISVTNFNEGGRLAVIQGNLIRNLFRREHEPEDKRGEGIGVEADAVVTGNTIEGAPTAGIQIGWGSFMRDVAASGNVIRRSRVGISVTSAVDAGSCLIANNLISDARDGAIRAMSFGAVLGPDLAHEPSTSGRIRLSGNVAV